MLEETEVEITIDIAQVNTKPSLACEDSQGGLFDISWSSLRALTSPEGRETANLQDTVDSVISERDQAVSGDTLKLKTRTRALDQLSLDINQGQILAGAQNSFAVACGNAGSWQLDMAPSQAEHITALNVSLLAFDSDEFEGLVYRIITPPLHGQLYASKAVSGESYREVTIEALLWCSPVDCPERISCYGGPLPCNLQTCLGPILYFLCIGPNLHLLWLRSLFHPLPPPLPSFLHLDVGKRNHIP